MKDSLLFVADFEGKPPPGEKTKKHARVWDISDLQVPRLMAKHGPEANKKQWTK